MCAFPVGARFRAPGMYGKLSRVGRWWRTWCRWRQLGACWPPAQPCPSPFPPRKLPGVCWYPHVPCRSCTSASGQRSGCILLLQAHVDKQEEKPRILYDSAALCNDTHQRNNGHEDYLSAETKICLTIIFALGKGERKTPVRSKKCKFWFK